MKDKFSIIKAMKNKNITPFTVGLKNYRKIYKLMQQEMNTNPEIIKLKKLQERHRRTILDKIYLKFLEFIYGKPTKEEQKMIELQANWKFNQEMLEI